ncbi:hypothetical protein [Acidovorax sp.]|uniref:hypothetical protein n=1 Tax=Acidovorax sp. TaxID=1872122 RepID=UPI00391F2216
MRFFDEIGLECHFEVGASGFLPGIAIRNGVLFVDPSAPASNALHEAGHLALLLPKFRMKASGDVSEVFDSMFASLGDLEPDSPVMRAAMASGDTEATAWAWAAGVHLGLAHELIIQDDEYDGAGAGIRVMLASGRYAGIHGLAHGGFCATKPGALATHLGLPAFPQLNTWLQKDFE